MRGNELKELIEKPLNGMQMMLTLVDNFQEGLLLYSSASGKILYNNPEAAELLGWNDLKKGSRSIKEILNAEYQERIRQRQTVSMTVNENIVKISLALVYKDLVWLHLVSRTRLHQMDKDMKLIDRLNSQLLSIFSQYDDVSMAIADGEDRLTYIGRGLQRCSAFQPDQYLGTKVSDLEERGILQPSVIDKVLKTGREQVVIQSTPLCGGHLIAFGLPLFDQDGHIKHVVAVIKDFAEHIKLGFTLTGLNPSTVSPVSESDIFNGLITRNKLMLDIKALIQRIAPTPSTVLVTGSTGTGKEVLARAIHKASDRSDRPFVKMNCGALPASLIESELFGYEPGSFTGASSEGKVGLAEAADGGTLFLDEIGELPLEQQVKLLRFLQEKTIVRIGSTREIALDTRIIAATNRDLRDCIREGSFREDLFYRLNVVSIHVPTLQQRQDDIPLLTSYFLKKFNFKYNQQKTLSRAVCERLNAYDWPGNVRELENLIERLVIGSDDDYIDEEHLDAATQGTMQETPGVAVNRLIPMKEAIEETEKQLLSLAKQSCGSMTEIAAALNVHPSTISRKLAEYGL
ncbi:MAG: sigma-54 interaction domain-containing protein [Anaerovoracaceae bacterium]|jgi:transcriptional regulator with PAS, ATPase and Fis domain